MQQRSWGPFTGKQLTIIICTIAIVVGLPVGASAVTGNNVFLTDASSGARAKVSGAGSLQISGTAGVAKPDAFKVYTAGTLLGTIIAPTEFPVVPHGRAFVVTSVHYTWFGAQLGGFPGLAVFPADADCNRLDSGYAAAYMPTEAGAGQVDFAAGLAIPAGRQLCGYKSGTTNITVSISGYAVSSSLVPSVPVLASLREGAANKPLLGP
jgi:hypothetical protein